MRERGNLPPMQKNNQPGNRTLQPNQFNQAPQNTAEEFYNTIDVNNYDKISSIYMAPTNQGMQQQRMPEPPSYPVFDESGRLVRAGERGGQYNPIKYADLNKKMQNNEFNYGGGNRYQMSQNEIIKYNIEKLGGLSTTLDSKFPSFFLTNFNFFPRNAEYFVEE